MIDGLKSSSATLSDVSSRQTIEIHFRVCSARYNRFHDQLIVTASSDTRVMLFNIASLSSEPYGTLNLSDDTKLDEKKIDLKQKSKRNLFFFV